MYFLTRETKQKPEFMGLSIWQKICLH